MEDKMFKDKTLLITGGTGSFGNAVLNRFLKTDIKELIQILRKSDFFLVMKKSKTICGKFTTILR